MQHVGREIKADDGAVDLGGARLVSLKDQSNLESGFSQFKWNRFTIGRSRRATLDLRRSSYTSNSCKVKLDHLKIQVQCWWKPRIGMSYVLIEWWWRVTKQFDVDVVSHLYSNALSFSQAHLLHTHRWILEFGRRGLLFNATSYLTDIGNHRVRR